MSLSAELSKLVVIVGPTAVGKTTLSIHLAKRLGAEIVSADSRLFYRGMDIGTAKPSRAEREGVKHHLIDISEPDEGWSLVRFQKEARAAITAIHSQGKVPLLVGGTGQYIRAVLYAWMAPEVPPNDDLRNILNRWAKEITPAGLHDRLKVLDPEAAAFIDPANLRRTVRALEVILLTGDKFSKQRKRGDPVYRFIQIGLMRPRAELYARIDERIDSMISAGFEKEVRDLLSQGYSAELPAMSAIGYREVVGYIQGDHTLEDAVMLIKRRTRQFVRRQANWFKPDDANIHWFEMGTSTLDDVEVLVRSFLDAEPREYKV
jgi:tRNA dimethylallyltransferase